MYEIKIKYKKYIITTIMTSQQRRIEPPVHDGPLEKDVVVPAAMQQPDPADSQRLLANRINLCKKTGFAITNNEFRL